MLVESDKWVINVKELKFSGVMGQMCDVSYAKHDFACTCSLDVTRSFAAMQWVLMHSVFYSDFLVSSGSRRSSSSSFMS